MLKEKIQSVLNVIKDKLSANEKLENKTKILSRQLINFAGVTLIICVTFLVFIIFITSKDKGMQITKDNINLDDDHEQIELATDGTKSSLKWQHFLEDSISEESKKREEQLGILKGVIDKKTEESKKEVDNEFSEIKARLSYALNEIDRLKKNQENKQDDISELAEEEIEEQALELGVTSITEKINIKPAMSSYNYIPATSYIRGNLLGGIAVSTSVTTASNPIPVIIKVTNRGNLPKDFAVKLDDCRILGSCYGDISSERAFIRAEELVCENKVDGLVISTKVAGVIYGDDGTNGIRGTVVSMSNKHLKNAAIGGILSGFSSTAKGQAGFDVTSFGTINSKKRGIKDMAQDGLANGVTSAAEKLADYHIKLAENISPVIFVPGGTKVDIVFTKSVRVGSFDVEELIDIERGKK